ncbi:ribonuclease H-like domain-containing protein [Tanacetum coccineum]
MGVTPISPPFCVVASKVVTLFKSSHKQHNHDEAISADRGLVPSRPPSVVAKLMGLEALPDSATTNQKQEMEIDILWTVKLPVIALELERLIFEDLVNEVVLVEASHDHNLWDIIVNGDLEEEVAPTGEQSSPPAPKTAKQLTVRRNQERVKSILLLAIPDEYLLKFHNVPDAKSLWTVIKSRFGGNDESKKMQKNVLKHQFENFTTASNETLDKAYDRFQKLISQLEVHGAPVSKEDINQKFLRSLPPSWSQIALIMRNKPNIDEIDIDDLYNNLRVYEDEMKRSSSSTSNS